MEAYLVEVFLVYGFSFVLFGVSALLHPGSADAAPHLRHLWLLGLFGLAHGANELFDCWQLAYDRHGDDVAWFGAAVLVVSYVPLVEFARRTLPHHMDAPLRILTSPAAIYGAIGLLLAALLVLSSGDPAALSAGARYFMVLPAGLATAFVMRRAFSESPSISLGLAAALAIYALLAGLIVSPAAVLPGWLPTSDDFAAATGLPVQLFRAACAVVAMLTLTMLVRSHADRNRQELVAANLRLQDTTASLEQRVQERTEDLTRLSEQRGLLLDNLPGRTAYFDADETYVLVGRQIEAWYGQPASDILGRRMADVLGADRYAVAKPYVETVLAGQATTYESTATGPDGATRYFQVAYVPDVSPSGEVQGFFALATDQTELREATRQVAESERRYRTLVDSGTIGIIVTDVSNRAKFANQFAAKLYGFESADELVSLDSLDALLDEAEIEVRARRRERRLAGEDMPGSYEMKCRRRDGTPFWALVHSARIEWAGEPAIQNTLTDITPQKEQEAAVQTSEQRFRDFAGAASDWFWEIDENQRITFSTHDMESADPLPGASIQGMSLADLGNAFYPGGEMDELQEIVRQRRECRGLVARRVLSGYPDRWVSMNAVPFYDEAGTWRGYRGTIDDITRERLAEEEAATFRAQLEAIFNHAPLEIGLKDREGRWLRINRRFLEANRKTESEVIGHLPTEIHGQEIGSGGEAHDRIVLDTKRPVDRVFEVREAHGTRQMWVVKVPIKGPSGDVDFVAMFATDITEQKETEKQLVSARQRFRDFASAASDSFWEIDENLRVTYSAFEGESAELLPDASVLGKTLAELGRELYPDGEMDTLHEIIRERRPCRGLIARRVFSGHPDRWVSFNAVPFYDEAGTWRGYRGTLDDITAERQAQEDAATFRAQLEAIFDHAPVQMGLKDRDGRWLRANRRFLEAANKTESEVIGRLPTEIHGQAVGSGGEALDREVLETGQPADRMITARVKGVDREIWDMKVPVRGKSGEIEFIAAFAIDMTEQKATERQLTLARQRFQDFAEQSSDWLWETDVDKHFTYVSSGWEDTYGVDSNTLIGMHIEAFRASDFTPEQEAEWQAVQAAIDERRAYRELPLTTRDPLGNVRRVLSNGKPYFNEDGEFAGFRGSSINITELVRSQEAVAASERRYRALLEGGAVGVFVFSADYRPLYVSQKVVDTFGYASAEEMLALPTLDAVLDETEIERLREVRRQRFSGVPVSGTYEIKCRRKDGSPIWILSHSTAIDWDGEPAVQATWSDITELKRQEAALHESEQRFRDFASAASDWFWEIDTDLRYTFVSYSFEEKTGIPASDLIGMSIIDLGKERYPDGEMEALAEAVRQRRECRGLIMRRVSPGAPDGWIELNGVPFFDERGAFKGLRGTVSDITAERRAQEEAQLSRIQLQTVFDHAPLQIGLKDRDGRWLRANSLFLKYVGKSEADISGKFPNEIFAEDLAAPGMALDRQVVETGEPGERNYTFTQSDRTRYFQELKVPIRNEAGNIEQIGVFTIDQTNEVHARQAVQESEHRLLEAQRVGRMGSWERDVRSGALRWSDEVFRIFGLEPGEIEVSFEEFKARIHPDDQETYEAGVEDARTGGNAFDLEHRIVLPDGSIRHVREIAEYESDETGALKRIIGTVQDITEIRLAQNELQASLREKETLLREIHHRVKNNLQIVSSLLYFEGRKLNDAASQDVFADIRTRLNAMTTVHERLYRADDLSKIEFTDYAKILTSDLERVFHDRHPNVSLSLTGEPFVFTTEGHDPQRTGDERLQACLCRGRAGADRGCLPPSWRRRGDDRR